MGQAPLEGKGGAGRAVGWAGTQESVSERGKDVGKTFPH